MRQFLLQQQYKSRHKVGDSLWEATGAIARRRGADFHRWHLFEVEADGLARLSDEGQVIGWYTDDEIRAFGAANWLAAPVQAIFSRLGLLV